MPDGVEAALDVVNQQQDGTQQHDEADADEDTALGVFQIGIDPADNQFSLRTGHSVPELRLDEGVESEAAGDGKQQSQDGDDGKQGAVGQCGGTYHDAVVDELDDGKIDNLEISIEFPLEVRHLIFSDAPYSIVEEMNQRFNSGIHGSCVYGEKESSRSISRVLSPCWCRGACHLSTPAVTGRL